MSDNTTKALKFIKELLKEKLPYRWWTPAMKGQMCPMYSAVNFDEISIEYIKREGINCAGFINLVRLYLGLSVPGVTVRKGKVHKAIFAGGTRAWFNYLSKHKRLEPFDLHTCYPKGTLLIRDYINKNDQGHVAIITTDNAANPWENKIAHSAPAEPAFYVLPTKPVDTGLHE